MQTVGFDSPAQLDRGTWTAEDSDDEQYHRQTPHSLGCHLCYHNVVLQPPPELSSGYFGPRHTTNPLVQMMAEEKQRLQQSDSISSGSTVAPGGGGHENKAYDPDESSSSLASTPSPMTAKKDAETSVKMEMADLTPPQVPKIIGNNEKMQHSKDYYVSVNEHKKGIR